MRNITLSVNDEVISWDALIVAAARLGGCSILLSEDMNAGQTIDTVTVANPFA